MRKRLHFLCALITILIGLTFILNAGNAFAHTTILKQQIVRNTIAMSASSTTYPLPSWWNGQDCDASYYHANNPAGQTSFILDNGNATWRGLEACGPEPQGNTNLDAPVYFVPNPNGTQENEFECTELVKRYLLLAYGLPSVVANGNQIVSAYSSTYPTRVNAISNPPTKNVFPQVGDVLSYTNANPAGHTAIITNITITDKIMGNATITTLEQNGDPAKQGINTHTITSWTVLDNSDGHVTGWLHPVQTNWPMFGYNAQHTHLNATESVLSTKNVSGLTLDWSYTTGDFIYNSSPAVFNGIVYIVSLDHKLYALDATTGAFIWSYTINVSGHENISSPTIANGVVYVGSDNNNLYALDAKTGALKWSYTIGSGTDSSPVVANGIVYIGSFDHNIYALDATTGAFIWSYTTGDAIESSPAVANGVVYVGSDDNHLYALDAVTGALNWSYTTSSPVNSSPAVANGVVYISVYNDAKLYALNATTGVLKWSYHPASNFVLTSSPAVANGIVYFGSGDYKLYALDAKKGTLKWSYPTAGVVFSSPTIANGVVYVGSEDNNLYALNVTTGTFIWSYTTGNSILSSPAVVNGMVYVGSDDYKLYAFHL